MSLTSDKKTAIAHAKKTGCCRCGNTDPVLLEFHYRDPSKKTACIAQFLLQNHYSLEDLLKEISKCDVVCANCHRKIEQEIVLARQELRSQVRIREQEEKEARKSSACERRRHLANASPIDCINEARDELRKHVSAQTTPEGDCIRWTGLFNGKTATMFLYQVFSVAKLVFALETGFFPEGHVKRTCGNYWCVKFEHLVGKNKIEKKRWNELPRNTQHQALYALFMDPDTRETQRERFMRFVVVGIDQHWEWIGGRIKKHPQFNIFGRPISARRVALALRTGELVPRVMQTCGRQHCVNPDHLIPKI